jgi:outer membrane protein, heavy metal efflux system
MRTRPWCVTVALVVVMCASANAQIVLTEADALSRLSPESPRVKALRSSIGVVRAETFAIGTWPNPRLYIGREAVAGVAETMITVAQPLPITGRRSLERSGAEELVGAATSRSDDALGRARADLRHAYAELAAIQVRERELSGARAHLQELAEVLAKREAQGDAAGFDRLRAERELFELDADLAAAGADRTRAQRALVSFFAVPSDPSAIVVVVDSATSRLPLPEVASLIETAEHNRGEQLALQREKEAARLFAEASGRRKIPEPELLVGTKSSSALGGDVGSVISVQAVIPLFNHGQPERAIAEAKAAQAQARLDAFGAALRNDIATLHAVAIERRRAAERYRTALSNAADVERIARVSYEAGERGILELLDAYRLGLSSRLRVVALEMAAREAEIELEFVSGRELP